MQRYNLLLKVGGSPYNETRLFDLTAPEVIVLQNIHGHDAVKELRVSIKKPIKADVLRAVLEKKYAPALGKLRPKKTVESLFGPVHMALPEYLPGFEPKMAEDAVIVQKALTPDLSDQVDDELVAPKRRGRPPKAKPAEVDELDEVA